VKQLSDRVQYDTGFTDGIMGGPYKTEVDWSLPATTGISLPESVSRPRGGQFNLIGYSYGSLVAAQTAAYYADKGQYVNNLVLIGSPISAEFLSQLQSNSNIGNVVVQNLTFNKDPIYAGMPYSELVVSAPLLAYDMVSDPQAGAGHFYYVPNNQTGHVRRTELAQQLYESGLR
jgi:pimeloyl-ACP methyl ester carboxylesterase